MIVTADGALRSGNEPRRRSLKVCFAVPGFYPLLNRSIPGGIGGSEIRALTFARRLAGLNGYAVSAVAYDYGQPKVERYDVLTVYRDDFHRLRERKPQESSCFDGVAQAIRDWFRRPITTLLGPSESEAWRIADADVYCTFGASDYTSKLANWCRSVDRPLVLFAGSDQDFSADYRPDSQDTNVWGSRCAWCYDAVVRAHVVVVQTNTQVRLLAERFGRRGIVIPNPIDLESAQDSSAAQVRRIGLWAGKSDTVKRPELMVELARLCPEVPFVMVLNRANPAVFEQVMARRPANLQIVEQVVPEEIGRLYADAFALINTSRCEGFPNTFLEAGKYGIPVLSLEVDPDLILARHQAGVVAGGDIQRLAETARRFRADPGMASKCGANLREYVRRRHALPDCVAQLDMLLQQLVSNGHPG